KWEVETSVIGVVTGDGRLTIDHHGHRIVDVDPRTVAIDSPTYDRPYAKPAWQDALNADSAEKLPRPSTQDELREQVLAVVTSPNLASKGWITEQFDHYVMGNTALAQPDDAGVVRVDELSGLGVAISADANGRFAKLDPYVGAQLALAEAFRNVATVGARPLAVTDCLNFGSPEDPDAMWQLVRAITGLADGCQELEIPVTGGNVSLYNSTGEPGLIDSSINPTPVVGVLGVMDDVSRVIPSGWHHEGLAIYALGKTSVELSGSEWARAIHQHLGGRPPRVDFRAEEDLAHLLIDAATQGLSRASHDLSGGGLVQALVESSSRFGVGATVDLDELAERDEVDLATLLFSESGARAIIAVDEVDAFGLEGLAAKHDVHALRVGTTGGGTLAIAGVGEFDLFELGEAREGTLRSRF
nr:phosphoribosylformylglycinamidine synthase II [Actinomycetales bacterium]